jgi:ribonuclease HII
MPSKTDYVSASIIEDSDSEEVVQQSEEVVQKIKKTRQVQKPLQKFHKEDANIFEIGVDEAGRGPLFGRVYTAAVVLPKDNSFDHSRVKDSKKFNSKKKIQEAADYVKENAIAWYVSFEDEKVIDEINILQATQRSMHSSILETRKQVIGKMKDNGSNYKIELLIDGNYFNPITILNKTTSKIETIPYTTIEGGDNKYTAIAAASILAKVERDKYIEDLCVLNPELIEHYGIDSNKGYGSKKHMDGIKQHGITKWHRKTFGICKEFA